jgi:hypothetical protein
VLKKFPKVWTKKMKVKISFDMPRFCAECPCHDGVWDSCKVEDRPIDDGNEKPDWCPLEEVKDNEQ